jgi:hypothetical protein
MEDPEEGGKRLSPEARRRAAESQSQRTEQATAKAPVPRPKPKSAPGVPMAGQSYSKRKADEVRMAKGTAPAPAPKPKPKTAPPTKDLEENFNPDEDLDLGIEEEADPGKAGTPSSIYSTRRALAEQVNKDVGVRHDDDPDSSGVASLIERRENWKKLVEKQEQEGKSPYVMRWAKVSFFPFLYFLISLSLLRKITYEYGDYYTYDSFYILMGFVVGAIIVVAFSVSTMLRAKRSKRPILLRSKSSWMGVVIFIGGSFYLAWVYGLAFAWQFSIGFLGAGLLVVLMGFLIEKTSKGTFWIKDPANGSEKRWLEFVPSLEG